MKGIVSRKKKSVACLTFTREKPSLLLLCTNYIRNTRAV